MFFSKIQVLKEVCENKETTRFQIIKAALLKIWNRDSMGVKLPWYQQIGI